MLTRRRTSDSHFAYDLFLAHAGVDLEQANRLYDSLSNRADVRLFLDGKTLNLGDNWRTILPQALAGSRIIVVLVSRAWETTHYAEAEVARAIDRARNDPRVRVVPVYLDEDCPAPYGLEQIKGAHVGPKRDGELADIAVKLLALLDQLRAADSSAKASTLGTESPPTSPPLQGQDDLPDVLSKYLDAATRRYEEIPLIGFERDITVPICIEDLYVELNAVHSADARTSKNYDNAEEAERGIREHGAQRKVKMLEAFAFASTLGAPSKRGKRGLVILGDPGSGKTTQLKQVLIQIARGGAGSMSLPAGTVPVLLPLRELTDVPDTFDGIVSAIVGKAEGVRADAILEALASHERVLYLIDGLDEVRDTKTRAAVSRAIEAAIDDRATSYFVVTCRYTGYTDATRLLQLRFCELHLRPLSEQQVAQFVRNWFHVVERATLHEASEVAARADDKARSLVWALRQPKLRAKARVFGLTRNPLLLTAICLVHLQRGKLPEHHAALYRECLEVMLERWQLARKTNTSIEATDAQSVLRPVAHWLHEHERAMATADELGPVLAPALESAEVSLAPDAFLQAVRNESGVLTGWSGDRYGLMHLGLQEYLTARQIAVLARAGETAALDALARRFGESWWQEVVLLLLGLDRDDGDDGDVDSAWLEALMKRVVEHPAFVEHGELVDQCLADAKAQPQSAGPFLALARRTPGRDEALWTRQRAALRVVERLAPNEAVALAQGLRGHPSADVRAWVDQQLRIGPETFVAQPGGYTLVRIPGGTFQMGSPPTEDGRLDREGPQHNVTLEDFYLGRCPVTNEEYGRFLEANPGASEPAFWSSRQLNHPRQPVVGVSWEKAIAYCEWAGLTLPTEAQWEFACRAGTTTRYWLGNHEGDLARIGWYSSIAGEGTHPVGGKPANPFGLYDMHGNVLEWCLDGAALDNDLRLASYSEHPARPGDGLRRKPVGNAGRVLRGGAWGFAADAARSAFRIAFGARYFSRYTGFRAARPRS